MFYRQIFIVVCGSSNGSCCVILFCVHFWLVQEPFPNKLAETARGIKHEGVRNLALSMIKVSWFFVARVFCVCADMRLMCAHMCTGRLCVRVRVCMWLY